MIGLWCSVRLIQSFSGSGDKLVINLKAQSYFTVLMRPCQRGMYHILIGVGDSHGVLCSPTLQLHQHWQVGYDCALHCSLFFSYQSLTLFIIVKLGYNQVPQKVSPHPQA